MTTSLVIAPPRAVQVQADALQLIDDYVKELDARVASGELAATTRQNYEQAIAKFVDYATSHRSVDANVVRSWIADLKVEGYKPGTVNLWLTAVRSFFAWAEGQHLIAFNPAAGVKAGRRRGTQTHHKRETLTDAEVLRVLDTPDLQQPAGHRDRAYLHLRAYTGCRDVELHRSNVEDLQTRGGRLTLNVQGKGHEEADRFIVVVPDAERPLRDWLAIRGDEPGPLFTSLSDRNPGGRLSLSAIRHMVKGYYKAAGVAGKAKTSHSLRHSAITSAAEHGAALPKVQSMAGHASVETTMIYYHELDRVNHPAEEFVKYDEADTSSPSAARGAGNHHRSER